MIVWPIEARGRKAGLQPPKQGLVARVHPKGHLWLLSVAPERAFADQEANDHAPFEFGQLLAHSHICSARINCFTGRTNVKRRDRAAALFALVDEGSDDEAAGWLLALAVGLDVVARLQVLVDDLALERAHRFQLDWTAFADRRLCGLICGGPKAHRAAFTVSGGINLNALAGVAPLKAMR